MTVVIVARRSGAISLEMRLVQSTLYLSSIVMSNFYSISFDIDCMASRALGSEIFVTLFGIGLRVKTWGTRGTSRTLFKCSKLRIDVAL